VCGDYPTVNIHLLHTTLLLPKGRGRITNKEEGVEDDETPQLPQVKISSHYLSNV